MKLVLAFLFYFICIPQHEPEKIHWNENKKLSWEDFRGKPQRTAVFVASSNTGIGFHYSYSLSNGEVEVKYSVESFFYPKQSWYLPEKVSPYILKHEQTHFDISELHARILRKNLDDKNFSKKIKTEIEAIYNETEQQRRAMQTKFDSETAHSRNTEKEIQWENYVAQQLTKYEPWK